ncbi:CDP-alcohol phosphatidyltransferase family protein [Methanocella sp. MCL-LM]|uniref:CDP-alcohol phosphatidyltransferase family protein n=1 Tax=Methanocella sp. MCL-LM TaxID=3412035 RepID=UPI003C72D16E
MNLTKYRDHLIGFISPISRIFAATGITPNQITLLSLVLGIAAGAFYGLNGVFTGAAYAGAAALLLSGLLDFIDGGVARINNKASKFGAAIDWIVDKYVDCIVLLGIGLGGMVDMRLVVIAIIGSMINTFIKPVVYAEIGYQQKHDGKIKDPLEGIGIFGRPETVITLIVFSCLSAFTFFGYSAMTIAVAIVAIGTNLSALQRVLYLYWNRTKF